MGLIARDAGAPIADGETPSGTEVEAEFSTIFTEVNGALDDANVKTGAGLLGTKLGSSTLTGGKVVNNVVTGAKFASDTITTEEMEAAAVPQAYIDTDTGTETTTTSATFVDVPGITAWTVTPGSTSNYIQLEFICYVDDGTAGTRYDFAFEIDTGSDTVTIGRFDLESGSPDGWYVSWMATAPSASEIIITPRYLRQAGSTTSSFSVAHSEISKIFRGLIIPVK